MKYTVPFVCRPAFSNARATLNTVMRNGMLLALAVFLVAALAFQPLWGNTGLWIALNGFFVARGGILWWGMERRKASLFS